MSEINSSRRSFLKQGGALSAAGTVGAPWLLNLSAMADAAAATLTDDYKALVCVFLAGGNDACNTILPKLNEAPFPTTSKRRSSMQRYEEVRSQIALPAAQRALTISTPAGQHPIHPALQNVHRMYGEGKVAFVANVGNVFGKTDRSTPDLALPPRLRSHNDQQGFWQSGRMNSEPSGWGGRFAQQRSFNPTGLPIETRSNKPYADYFRSVIIGSNVPFGMGDANGTDVVRAYGLGAKGDGVIPLLKQTQDGKLFGAASQTLLRQVMRGQFKAPRANLLEQDYMDVQARALDTQAYLSDALKVIPDTSVPEDAQLTKDLLMVARVIRAHANAKGRQVFFVTLDQFDTHGNQNYKHPLLLAELDTALNRFQSALGNASGKVVTFTASDFGRLLHANGDGTDHAWGGHALVMGDAVVGKGGKSVIGTIPSYETDAAGNYVDPQMTGDGAMVPTISVQSYAGALGRWFGLDDATLTSVFNDGTASRLASSVGMPHADGAGVLKGLL